MTILALADAVLTLDGLTKRIPVYGCIRGVVLDTLLGPAEDIEYVSRTAPAAPPQAY